MPTSCRTAATSSHLVVAPRYHADPSWPPPPPRLHFTPAGVVTLKRLFETQRSDFVTLYPQLHVALGLEWPAWRCRDKITRRKLGSPTICLLVQFPGQARTTPLDRRVAED